MLHVHKSYETVKILCIKVPQSFHLDIGLAQIIGLFNIQGMLNCNS